MTHFTIHNVSSFEASLSFCGVPYGDIDRTGHLSVWSLMKMFEGARIVSLYKGLMDHDRVVDRNAAVVIVSQNFSISPRIHSSVGLFTKLTMKFNIEMKELGRTSLAYSCTLEDEETGETLGENNLRFVRINRNTRRPIPFPDWFQEKYAKYKSTTAGNIRKSEIPTTPSDAFSFSLTARHSDTDRNGHINQAMYIKYCLDCATDAAVKGFYRKFDSDMCLYPSVEWEIIHRGESRADDPLTVYTWQDQDDHSKIMFSIDLNKKQIFFARTTFVITEPKRLKFGKL